MLQRSLFAVVVSVGLIVGASGAVGWSGHGWSGSGSSGSGSGPTSQPTREVRVGRHVVMLPGDETTLKRVDESRVTWQYGGTQTVGSTKVDLLGAMGVLIPRVDVIGEWEVG